MFPSGLSDYGMLGRSAGHRCQFRPSTWSERLFEPERKRNNDDAPALEVVADTNTSTSVFKAMENPRRIGRWIRGGRITTDVLGGKMVTFDFVSFDVPVMLLGSVYSVVFICQA